jgi:hypothetical protein
MKLTPRGVRLLDHVIVLTCCASIAVVLLLALTGGF